jgi:hypothetical protein
MLTDVIGKAALLDHKVKLLAGDLAEFAAAGADRDKTVRTLVEEISSLKATVQALVDDGKEEEPDDEAKREAQLPNWDKLAGQAEATDAWDRLYTWLATWFVPVYGITVEELKPCWTWHTDIREQLSAVRVAWVHAYRLNRPGQAVDWHQRVLPELREWLSGKKGGRHQPFSGCSADQQGGKHQFEYPYPPQLAQQLAGLKHGALSLPNTWWHGGREAHIRSYPVTALDQQAS